MASILPPRMLSRLLYLALLALLVPSPARAEDTPITVAVLDIRASGVEPRVAEALLDVVTEEVAKAPRYKVLSRKEIERLLTEEARKQLVGCDETSCLAELAGALNTELLVTGEISRLQNSTLLTLQLINNRFATVMNRVSINWPGSSDALPDVAQAASQLLVLERGVRKPGALKVQSAPLVSQIFLDEKPITGTAKSDLDVGLHLVRVTSPGFEERTIPVIIKSGLTSSINGGLQSIPVYKRPWFWSLGIVGTGALGALGAGILLGAPLLFVLLNFGGGRVTGSVTPPNATVRP